MDKEISNSVFSSVRQSWAHQADLEEPGDFVALVSGWTRSLIRSGLEFVAPNVSVVDLEHRCSPRAPSPGKARSC